MSSDPVSGPLAEAAGGRTLVRLAQIENAHRLLIEEAPTAIAVYRDDLVLYINPAFSRLLGYTLAEINAFEAPRLLKLVHPDDRTLFVERFKRRAHGIAEPWRYPARLLDARGHSRWTEINSVLVPLPDGPAVLVQITDMTERHEFESMVVSQNERLNEFQSIINRSGVMVLLWRAEPHWPVEYCTANVIQLGYTAEDFMYGRIGWTGITHPEDVPRLEREVKAHLAAGRDEFSQQYRLIVRDGQVRWMEDRNRVLRDAAGIITHVQGIVLDITERRLAEEAYRDMAENSLQGLMIMQNGRIVYANPELIRLSGYSLEELQAMTPPEMAMTIHPDDREWFVRRMANRQKGLPEPARYEYRQIHKDGRVRWFEVFVSRVVYHGQPALQVTELDITERKIAEAALRESEARNRLLIEASSDGVLMLDDQCRIGDANPAASDIWGYSLIEIRGQAFTFLWRDEDRGDAPALWEKLAADGEMQTVRLLRRADGSIFPGECHCRRLPDGRVHVVVRDVSLKRQTMNEFLESAQDELRQFGAALHDTLGQQLTGLSFLAAALRKRLADRKAAEADEAARLVMLASECLEQTRRIARGLAPISATAEGLVSALGNLAEGLGTLYNIAGRFRVQGGGHVYSDTVAHQLFHIAQEAVSNAVRHARPRRLSITLKTLDAQGVLVIRNDGQSFAAPDGRQKGVGLRLMRYRAELIGGWLDIAPGPRGGAVLTCRFPNVARPDAPAEGGDSGA